MKQFVAPILIAACTLTLVGTNLHSQTQPPSAVLLPSGPRTPVQALQTIKAENQKLLEQQAATLLQLDTLTEQAKQVRILAKRS